jgi:hypothetical protein
VQLGAINWGNKTSSGARRVEEARQLRRCKKRKRRERKQNPTVGEMDRTAEKKRNVVEELLRENGGWAVIDGGLATELESNGADIKDALWSSKCLFSCPQLITKVTSFQVPSFLFFFSLSPSKGY